MTSLRSTGETIDLIAATNGRITAPDNPVSARAMLAGLNTLLERSGLAKLSIEAVAGDDSASLTSEDDILFSLFDEAGATAARIHMPHRLFEAMYVRLYGGNTTAPVAAKPAATQIRYAQRLGRQLCNILDSALPKPDMLRDSAIDAVFDSDEQPDDFDTAWSMAFSVAAAGIEPCHICFVLSDQLAEAMPQASGRRTAAARPQPAQNQMIARAGGVPLIVRSELVAAHMPASRLLNLRPGDVLPIPTPVAIPVTVAGQVFATASIGEWQGSAALRIESFSEGNGA